MSDDPKSITFVASLPPIQSAISLDGVGEGARVKLDIPRLYADAALWLQAFGAGKPLKVTVEVLESNDKGDGGNTTTSRRAAKRRE